MSTIMRIYNQFRDAPQMVDIIVHDPVIVPRVGDRINMGYNPWATVKSVAYEYEGVKASETNNKTIMTARSLVISVLTE